jgi:hypothetical protein
MKHCRRLSNHSSRSRAINFCFSYAGKKREKAGEHIGIAQ